MPFDFESDGLGEALVSHGFDTTRKTLVCWLGVSYYLTVDGIVKTLTAVRDITPVGSFITFDYGDESLLCASEPRVKKMLMLASASGEPMKSCFSFPDICDLLCATGYKQYELMTPLVIQLSVIGEKGELKAFEHVNYLTAKRI